MKLLMVLAYVGTLASAGWIGRVSLRWWLIQRRPVLTCAELATAEPGTPVLVVGRTAAGPVLTAPHSGKPCVGYQSVAVHTEVHNDNWTESTADVSATGGDNALHGDGVRVLLAPEILANGLFLGNPMMVISGAPRQRAAAHHDCYDQEYIVQADRPVIAAGLVTAPGSDPTQLQLAWRDGHDGSAEGSIASLSRRYARDVALLVLGTLLLAGLAILLTRLVVGGPGQ